jgi:hypothetical protein
VSDDNEIAKKWPELDTYVNLLATLPSITTEEGEREEKEIESDVDKRDMVSRNSRNAS